MKNIVIVFLFVVSISSCENILYKDQVPPNGFKTETFKLEAFDRLDINNAFDVKIIKSNVSEVNVKGAEDDIKDLELAVRNGKLEIKYDKRISLKKIRRYKMYVEVKTNAITEVISSSASNTDLSGFGLLEKLSIQISGASKFILNNEIKELNSEISGASNLTLNENVSILDAQVSGASKLYTENSQITSAYLDLSGASKAEVTVSDKLDIVASGASKVSYKGNPVVTQKLSGSSSVTKE